MGPEGVALRALRTAGAIGLGGPSAIDSALGGGSHHCDSWHGHFELVLLSRSKESQNRLPGEAAPNRGRAFLPTADAARGIMVGEVPPKLSTSLDRALANGRRDLQARCDAGRHDERSRHQPPQPFPCRVARGQPCALRPPPGSSQSNDTRYCQCRSNHRRRGLGSVKSPNAFFPRTPCAPLGIGRLRPILPATSLSIRFINSPRRLARHLGGYYNDSHLDGG